MALETNNVKTGSGNLPMSFSPGNHKAKINSLELRVPGYVKKGQPVQYELIMDLETAPIGGTFVGWKIDKDDESKGTYLGQTGRVKSREWPYKDGTWKNPKTGKVVEFSYTQDILVFIQMIEDECGTTFLKDTSGTFKTIVEVVKAFNEAKPFKDIFLHWCIGGQVQIKDDGHPQYFMFLPKFKKGFKLFTNEEDLQSLATYDPQTDLSSKDGPAQVTTFAANGSDTNDDATDGGMLWDEATDDDNPFAVDQSDDDPFATEEENPMDV